MQHWQFHSIILLYWWLSSILSRKETYMNRIYATMLLLGVRLYFNKFPRLYSRWTKQKCESFIVDVEHNVFLYNRKLSNKLSVNFLLSHKPLNLDDNSDLLNRIKFLYERIMKLMRFDPRIIHNHLVKLLRL